MKQNGQWLSHVRTRSNTALASSRPSGAPSALSTTTSRSRPPRRSSSSTRGPSACSWYAMTSRRSSPLTVDDLVARVDTRVARRGSGRDGDDSCGGHRRKSTGPNRESPPCTVVVMPVDPARTARVDTVLLAEPRGFCAGVEMAIKALGVDGARVRAARVLLPRDRPQPARRRAVPRAGRDLRRRRRRRAARRAADALRPRLGARGRRGRERGGPLRRQRGVPARHQGAPRSQGARPQGLHGPLRRPHRPRRSGRHARGRARVDPPARAGGAARRTARTGRRSRNASRCWRRRRSRTTSGPTCSTQTRERFPQLWTASRNDLCFATTNRQTALTRIATAARRGRRHRQRELVEHDRARRRSRATRAARSCSASTAPRSSTSTRSAARRSSA